MKLTIILLLAFVSCLVFPSDVAASGFNIDFLNLVEANPSTNAMDAYIKIKIPDTWQFLNNANATLNFSAVGIVDTGVTSFHPEFGGVDFGSTPPDTRIDTGEFDADIGQVRSHGTNVAGIVGANNVSATSSVNYILPPHYYSWGYSSILVV